VFGLLQGCAGAGFQAPRAPGPEEIPALERATASSPRDVDLRVRLGAAYRAAGRLDDARRVLEDALRTDPGSERAIFVLGAVYDEAGADSIAGALYRRYLDEHPDGALREELTRRLEVVRRRALERSVNAALAREAELAGTPPEPRTVGVFPFTYQGSDERLRPLGRALAEMITTDLSQSSRLRVLERLRVQLLIDEMALSDRQRVDPATAARSGRLLGAARVVQGVLDGNEAELVMEAVVVPVGDDAPPPGSPLSARDPAQRFFDMENRIVLDLFQSMNIELTAAEREAVTHRPTDNLNALLAFGLGLEAQDAGRYEEAAQHFNDAAALDPNFGAASSKAIEAGSLTVAQSVDIDAFVQEGLTSLGGGAETEYVEWLTRLTSFSDLEGLLPGILGRDAVPELLGREGIGESGSTVEIIFRRPGGDR
jgi:Tfp pilus assembly protein PilF/TolB-like protein